MKAKGHLMDYRCYYSCTMMHIWYCNRL